LPSDELVALEALVRLGDFSLTVGRFSLRSCLARGHVWIHDSVSGQGRDATRDVGAMLEALPDDATTE
jgi:hypothetical protein